MTEDQIERMVERQFNQLDAKFMAGKLTQAEYDTAVQMINDRAECEYRFMTR